MSELTIWQQRYGTYTVTTRQELMTDEYLTETWRRKFGSPLLELHFRCRSKSRAEAEAEQRRQEVWAEKLWVQSCREKTLNVG